MLQEINQKQVDVNEWRVKIVGLRLLRRGFALIQPVEGQVRDDEIRVGNTTPVVEPEGLLARSEGFVVFARKGVDGGEVVGRDDIARVDLCPTRPFLASMRASAFSASSNASKSTLGSSETGEACSSET